MNLWNEYDEEFYNKFERTKKPKAYFINETEYYPLKWTSDKSLAKKNWK